MNGESINDIALQESNLANLARVLILLMSPNYMKRKIFISILLKHKRIKKSNSTSTYREKNTSISKPLTTVCSSGFTQTKSYSLASMTISYHKFMIVFIL